MRSVRSGAVLMAVSQLVNAVTGFLTTIAVARLLGSDGVAAYTVALSLLLILGMVASLGLENGIAWSVASGRWSPRAAFVESQVAAFVLGVAGIAVAVLLALAAPDAFGGLTLALVAVAAGALPFLISWQYARWLAAALDRYEAFVVPPALASTLALVACVAGAIVADTEGMVVGLLAAYVLTALIAIADGVRSARRPAPVPPAADSRPGRLGPLREATAFGLRANAANALQFLNYRLDLFVLSAVVSASDLGVYSAAVSATSVMFLAPQTLAYVVFPRVAALSAAGDEDQRGVVEAKSLRHVSLLTLLSLPVVAVGIAIGVPLLYGSEFRGAIGLGMILLPGVALFGVAAVLSATINGRGRPELTLRAAAWSTPPALLLYAVLIPTLGDYGAAIASTASYALNFAVTAAFYSRATGEPALPLLVPTREEVADLRALVRRG